MAGTIDLIPIALIDSCFTMSPSKTVTGDYATIFVGIVDGDSYTDEMWNKHSNDIKKLFKITDPNMVYNLKVERAPGRANVVNSESLTEAMITATSAVEGYSGTILRIVGLGVGSSGVVTDALESLIRRWGIEPQSKHVQFVVLLESPVSHYLHFCKRVVMKELCGQLQYCNMMDFNKFGYLETSRGIDHLLSQVLRDASSTNESMPLNLAALLHGLQQGSGDGQQQQQQPSTSAQ